MSSVCDNGSWKSGKSEIFEVSKATLSFQIYQHSIPGLINFNSVGGITENLSSYVV